ncbi:hypothetical protein LIER_01465 [Lithospermum erythrorhizon]|uniref:Zinc finger C5HC2-type domain-containing protein n=1 Tax=Lithospermum erythrorhizon TaxID=34254 RepID=A0AAV3NM70_LITER
MLDKEMMQIRDTLTDAERELAIYFGISLSLHKVARWCLYQSPPQGFDTIQKDDNIVLCTNCGRDCFFSYVIHEDSSDPICLLHDWSRFKGCKLYLHQDIKEIEDKQSELFKKDNQLEQQVQDALYDIASTTANKWLLKFMVKGVVSL